MVCDLKLVLGSGYLQGAGCMLQGKRQKTKGKRQSCQPKEPEKSFSGKIIKSKLVLMLKVSFLKFGGLQAEG
jgi:hypothetical protein